MALADEEGEVLCGKVEGTLEEECAFIAGGARKSRPEKEVDVKASRVVGRSEGMIEAEGF